MNKLRVFGVPYLNGNKLISPYMDLNAKRSFEFYKNYHYATSYVSDKKETFFEFKKYEKTIADEALSRFRRLVLFSDSSGLIPMPYSALSFNKLRDRASKTSSIDHCTFWITKNGTKFILNEPYRTNDFFNEILDEEGLICIEIHRDLSPYCGSWNPKPNTEPGTKSYLICEKKDISEIEYIQIQLELARTGYNNPNSIISPPWNCLKGVQYV
jgi:hypothetical protein